MESNLSWCFKQKRGIKLIESNLGIAREYLADSRRDLQLVDKNEPKWNIIKEYYVCYNAFYSLLVKCGVKCEIHDCTIKLMEFFEFEKIVQEKLNDLKSERIGVQYYLGNSKKDYLGFAKDFLDLCEVKFLELNDFKINEIREKIKEALNEK